MPNTNWYAIHTASGRENKARELLISRAIAYKFWKDTIFDVLIPTEKIYVTRNGKRKIVDKKVFPGYIFVQMYVDKDSEKLVQSTEGISGFVRSGNKPVPVSDNEIKKILKKLDDSDTDAPKSNYKLNDIVVIINGPFSDLEGKIKSIDEIKGKVKAYLNIFSQETLVELDIKDINMKKN